MGLIPLPRAVRILSDDRLLTMIRQSLPAKPSDNCSYFRVTAERFLSSHSAILTDRAHRQCLAGWKSSTRLPEGSLSKICAPPGPLTMSFRNCTPAARNRRPRPEDPPQSSGCGSNRPVQAWPHRALAGRPSWSALIAAIGVTPARRPRTQGQHWKAAKNQDVSYTTRRQPRRHRPCTNIDCRGCHSFSSRASTRVANRATRAEAGTVLLEQAPGAAEHEPNVSHRKMSAVTCPRSVAAPAFPPAGAITTRPTQSEELQT